MITKGRKLILDIFDYSNHNICTLYDNSQQSTGQAENIVVTTERNGWKELSFNIPYKIHTINGEEDNYRLQLLQSDYKIRLTDDSGIDWFIIMKPSFSHKGRNKTVSVTASHISQLLKIKNLGLEFSDDFGNNVGTAKELLTTILDGTGWTVGEVADFLEEDTGAVKVRSLKASSKTGAFKLITQMCDLFEAKPVFHGNERTVDIIPMNPFSKIVDGDYSELRNRQAVELAYSKNIKNVTRSSNSENLVTKLYAYGSFGDKTKGYCDIKECLHKEYVFTLTKPLLKNESSDYYFSIVDDSKTTIYRSFTIDRDIPEGAKIIYSTMDPASQMYVWIETEDEGTFDDFLDTYYKDIDDKTEYIRNISNVKYGKAYFLDEIKSGKYINGEYSDNYSIEQKQNWFSYLMSFDYFKDIKLFDDLCLQKLAGFQRIAHFLENETYVRSALFSNSYSELANTIGGVNFCKLDVEKIIGNSNGNLTIQLKKTDKYPDGVIYRTDYDVIKSKRFPWIPTDELDEKGDPIIKNASILYILHDGTTPITWVKGYLKGKDKDEDPDNLVFHISYVEDDEFNNGFLQDTLETDKYLLFQSNSINGMLGTKESQDEAVIAALSKTTTIATVEHNVMFGEYDASDVQPVPKNTLDIEIEKPEWYSIDSYGWYWKYYTKENESGIVPESELYFCYYDHYGEESEREFKRVHFSNSEPAQSFDGDYWYDWQRSKLYRKESSSWRYLDADTEKEVSSYFSSVYNYCLTRDRLYKGLSKNIIYTHISNTNLPIGNYYIKDDFGSMYLFTTVSELSAGDMIVYDTQASGEYNRIKQITGANAAIDIDPSSMEPGYIDDDGNVIEDLYKSRSADFIELNNNSFSTYSFSGFTSAYPLNVYRYDENYNLINDEDVPAISKEVSGYDGTFTVSSTTKYIKITSNLDSRIFNDTYIDTDLFKIKSGNYNTLPLKIITFLNNTVNDKFLYNADNIMEGSNTFESGEYSSSTGSEIVNSAACRSASFYSVIPKVEYELANYEMTVDEITYIPTYTAHFYNYNKNWISSETGTNFTIPNAAYYMKLSVVAPSEYEYSGEFLDQFNTYIKENIKTRAVNRDSSIIYPPDVYYEELSDNITNEGENNGIVNYINKLSVYSDKTFIDEYMNMIYMQDTLKAFEQSFSNGLGDMYREGWWQKNDYVDGDEDKLYKDAIDSLEKISKPETTYQIDYLDLYGLQSIEQYFSDDVTKNVMWPDLSIVDAAHLIDPELDVNCWAYFDKIQKCYDKPEQTKITINTNLTTISQHSFTDVFTNIANVATQIKGKEAVIDKASNLSDSGEMNVDNIKRAVKNINSSGIELFDGTVFNWATIKEFLNNV